jgi:hypothetical protein
MNFARELNLPICKVLIGRTMWLLYQAKPNPNSLNKW